MSEKFIEVSLDRISLHKYKKYGISTLEDRAIPDLVDGLKPVHRRALWSAYELGIRSNSAFVKSARVVGDCFVAGTLVHLADGTQIPIESMKVGMAVLTDTGVESVTNTFALPEADIYEVITDKGIVRVTGDQIFYSENYEIETEIVAKDLKPGTKIKAR